MVCYQRIFLRVAQDEWEPVFLMEKQLRKYRDMLYMSGLGTAVFGVWYIIKAVIYLLVDKQYFYAAYGDGLEDLPKVAIVIFVMLALGIEMTIHLLVGRAACREAHGQKRGIFYLIVDAVLVGLSIYSLIYVAFFTKDALLYFDTYATLFVEGTADVVMGEMLYAGIQVKRLRKVVAADGKEGAYAG